MICPLCRKQRHYLCQQHRPDGTIEPTWCDCQHETGTVLRPDRKPDPRRGA